MQFSLDCKFNHVLIGSIQQGIELNATMPLPRKNNRASVGFFSSSRDKRKSSGPKIAMQLAAGTLTLATGMESEA